MQNLIQAITLMALFQQDYGTEIKWGFTQRKGWLRIEQKNGRL